MELSLFEFIEMFGKENHKARYKEESYITINSENSIVRTAKQYYGTVERFTNSKGRVFYKVEDERKEKVEKRRKRLFTFPDEFYIKKPLVYMITNKINKKKYIGSTKVSLANRIMSHRKDALQRSKRDDTPISKSIRKYGFENFEFKVVQFWDDVETLGDFEDLIIRKCESWKEEKGYNIRLNNISRNELKKDLKRQERQEMRDYIKKNYKPNCKKYNGEALAKRFGITSRTVRNIANGK